MIVDSSSLIILSKINKLSILFNLYSKINITQEIYKEVVEEGILINAPDAQLIKKEVDNKRIVILVLDKKHVAISEELRKIYSQLGEGESEAIALALQEQNKEIIMDEKIGRQICRLYKVGPIGALKVLLESYKKGIVNEGDLRGSINDMVKNKFRIGADVINEFWDIFDKLKKSKNNYQNST